MATTIQSVKHEKLYRPDINSIICLLSLSLRGNAIIDENALQYVGLLSQSLRALVLSGNPVAENSEYRLNVLILLPELERLDKNPVFPEERAEAWERIRVTKAENYILIFAFVVLFF